MKMQDTFMHEVRVRRAFGGAAVGGERADGWACVWPRVWRLVGGSRWCRGAVCTVAGAAWEEVLCVRGMAHWLCARAVCVCN